MTGTSRTPDGARASVRQRLLAAADELFYADGVQTVGVDRVIDRAGVAKASLYRAFAGKDELAAAYLEARHTRNLGQLRDAVDAAVDPVGRLLAVFTVQGRWVTAPGYLGCPFTRAGAEAADGSLVQAAVEAYRRAVHELLAELVDAAHAPTDLVVQLELLFHGAGVLVATAPRGELRHAVRAAADTLVRSAAAPDPTR